MTSIQDLPPEILGVIFYHVYEADLSASGQYVQVPLPSSNEETDDYGIVGLLDDFPTSEEQNPDVKLELFHHVEPPYPANKVFVRLPSRESLEKGISFPYAPSRVSKYWLEVLQSQPKFWDQIVFDVASDPTPMLNAFSWSSSPTLFIHVTNTRKLESVHPSSSLDAIAAHEKQRVEAITRAWHPHSSKCLSVTFDLRFSSSLPFLPALLQYDSKILTRLSLNSRIPHASSIQRQNLRVYETLRPLSSYYYLRELHLDVDSFLAMGQLYRDWWWTFRACLDLHLRISISRTIFSSELIQQPGHSTQTLMTDFIRLLSRVRDLHTFSLFQQGADAYPYPDQDQVKVRLEHDIFFLEAQFEDLTAPLLGALFGICRLRGRTEIKFRNCEFPLFLDSHHPDGLVIFFAPHLYLIDIPPSGHLDRVISTWYGENLYLENCPSFNDDIIEKLVSTAPFLEHLTIRDCENFSYKALSSLVTERRMPALEGLQMDLPPFYQYLTAGKLPQSQQLKTIDIIGKAPPRGKDGFRKWDGIRFT